MSTEITASLKPKKCFKSHMYTNIINIKLYFYYAELHCPIPIYAEESTSNCKYIKIFFLHLSVLHTLSIRRVVQIVLVYVFFFTHCSHSHIRLAVKTGVLNALLSISPPISTFVNIIFHIIIMFNNIIFMPSIIIYSSSS